MEYTEESLRIFIKKECDIDSHIVETCKNKLSNLNGKIYCTTYGGMGCTWYIRRSSIEEQFEGFFLHGDLYGQYGNTPECNHAPYAHMFIQGYEQIL